MQDTELYQHILGLESPWEVSNVDLNVELGEIVVRVTHAKGTKFCCPECSKELGCYDHSRTRRWRHLDSCQFKTMLEASIPRVDCPEHGVKQAAVPWSSPNSRFTLMFEAFAIRLLKATQTVEGARTILRIGWEATWSILERAVERGAKAIWSVATHRHRREVIQERPELHHIDLRSGQQHGRSRFRRPQRRGCQRVFLPAFAGPN